MFTKYKNLFFLTSIAFIVLLICSCNHKNNAPSTNSQDIVTNLEFTILEKIDTIGCTVQHFDTYPENIFRIHKDGKFGLIDKDNNLILPCIYEGIGDMFRNNQLIEVWRSEDRYAALIEYEGGRIVMPFKDHNFETVSHTDRYLIAYCDYNKYTVIDLEREVEVIPDSKYWHIEGNGGYFFYLVGDGLYNLIDSTNTVVSPHFYKNVTPWKDKNGSLGFIVTYNDRYGVMMKKEGSFREVIPCEFDSIQEFDPYSLNKENPVLMLKKNGKKGILSTTGKILVLCVYDEISDEMFDGDLFSMSNEGQNARVVDVGGDELIEVVPPKYETLSWHYEGYRTSDSIVILGELAGIVDTFRYVKNLRK